MHRVVEDQSEHAGKERERMASMMMEESMGDEMEGQKRETEKDGSVSSAHVNDFAPASEADPNAGTKPSENEPLIDL
jgi:hypothetical protein